MLYVIPKSFILVPRYEYFYSYSSWLIYKSTATNFENWAFAPSCWCLRETVHLFKLIIKIIILQVQLVHHGIEYVSSTEWFYRTILRNIHAASVKSSGYFRWFWRISTPYYPLLPLTETLSSLCQTSNFSWDEPDSDLGRAKLSLTCIVC